MTDFELPKGILFQSGAIVPYLPKRGRLLANYVK